MAQQIKLKRSAIAGKVPTTGSLAAGELAINTVDGKLYFKRDDDTIQTIVTTNAEVTGSLNVNGDISASGDLYLDGGLYDSVNAIGTSGDFLTSTGTGITWQSAQTSIFDNVEAVYVTVKNESGTTLAKGTPVHSTASNAAGNIIGVIAASASDASTMPATVILNEELAPDAEGQAIAVGAIIGVPTLGFTTGDIIYVGESGGYTNVQPTGSNVIQNLGIVTKIHATNGAGVVLGAGRGTATPNLLNGEVFYGVNNRATQTTLASILSGSEFTYSGSFSGSFAGDGSNLTNISPSSVNLNLQQVTDNGSTTSNGITISRTNPFIILNHSASSGLYDAGGFSIRSNSYTTAPLNTGMGSISVGDQIGNFRGGITFKKASETGTTLAFYTDGTGYARLAVSSSRVTTPLDFHSAGTISGSDVYINEWNSVSASLATLNSQASSTPTLDQVTDQGAITTNSIEVAGLTATSVSSITNGFSITGVFKTLNGQNSIILESSGSTGVNPGAVLLEFRDRGNGPALAGGITYGGNGLDRLQLYSSANTTLALQGTSAHKQYVFTNSNGTGTGSFYWNGTSDAFIRKTGTGVTQFFGNATTATTATTASYATTAVTASYALSAPVAINTLQDITDNGNSTTTAITASAFVAGNPSTATNSFVYNGSVATLSQIANQASTLVVNQRQTSGGTLNAAINFRRQSGPATWTVGLLGSDDSFTISRTVTLGSYDRFKLTNTGAEIISGSLYVEGSITGSDITIDQWGSVSASLATLSSQASSTPTLDQVTDQGSTTTNSITVGGLTVNGSATATSFTGSLLGTASNATNAVEADQLDGQHGSYYRNASNINAGTIADAYLPNSISSDITGNAATATSASYAATASYVTQLSQNVTITGNLEVFGSSSFTYVTSSQLAVDDSYISVNVFEPAERFGGLKVYDSGSLSHQATASLSWDSTRNHWIYENVSGSSYTSAGLISGPRHTGSLGDEPYPTLNTIVRGQGGDHIYDSNITDDDTAVSTKIPLQVTGSVNITDKLYVNNIANYGSDPDKFLSVVDGEIVYRSGAQLLSDIGGQTAGTFVQNAGGGGQARYIMRYADSNSATTSSIYEDTSGNIGIGTTNPIQPLTVSAVANASTIALLGRAADNATRIDFYNNGGNSRLYTVASGNGAVEHYADANIPMVFSTNATERIRITAAGNVGIGIANPSTRLHVTGSVTIQGSGTVVESGISVTSTATSVTITTVPVATYDAVFVDYVVKNSTNLRAGTLMAVWDGTNIEWSDTSTLDLGSTTGVEFAPTISGGNLNVIANVPGSGWTFKTHVRQL